MGSLSVLGISPQSSPSRSAIYPLPRRRTWPWRIEGAPIGQDPVALHHVPFERFLGELGCVGLVSKWPSRKPRQLSIMAVGSRRLPQREGLSNADSGPCSELIEQLAGEGMSMTAIAAELNRRRIKTSGRAGEHGRWPTQTVKRLVARLATSSEM